MACNANGHAGGFYGLAKTAIRREPTGTRPNAVDEVGSVKTVRHISQRWSPTRFGPQLPDFAVKPRPRCASPVGDCESKRRFPRH